MNVTLRGSILAIVACLSVGSTSPLEAQTLNAGTWTGTITDPAGEAIDVTYQVTTQGDTLHIDLLLPESPPVPFADITLQDGKLRFTWDVGQIITCELAPVETGGFSGPCTDPSGGSGIMVMVPPKTEG